MLAAHVGGNAVPFKFRDRMTMAQLAEYLAKPSGEAARKWARRHMVPMSKVGREWRIDRRDVDLALKQQTAIAVEQQMARQQG